MNQILNIFIAIIVIIFSIICLSAISVAMDDLPENSTRMWLTVGSETLFIGIITITLKIIIKVKKTLKILKIQR
jgi:hypothetical protein